MCALSLHVACVQEEGEQASEQARIRAFRVLCESEDAYALKLQKLSEHYLPTLAAELKKLDGTRGPSRPPGRSPPRHRAGLNDSGRIEAWLLALGTVCSFHTEHLRPLSTPRNFLDALNKGHGHSTSSRP